MKYTITQKDEQLAPDYVFRLRDDTTQKCSIIQVDRATFQAYQVGDVVKIAMEVA